MAEMAGCWWNHRCSTWNWLMDEAEMAYPIEASLDLPYSWSWLRRPLFALSLLRCAVRSDQQLGSNGDRWQWVKTVLWPVPYRRAVVALLIYHVLMMSWQLVFVKRDHSIGYGPYSCLGICVVKYLTTLWFLQPTWLNCGGCTCQGLICMVTVGIWMPKRDATYQELPGFFNCRRHMGVDDKH